MHMTRFFGSFLKRFLFVIISFALLYLVVTRIQPPNSWNQASLWQILAIFIPLIATYLFSFNLFINHLIFSFIFALALFSITTFQALDALNITNSTIIILVTAFLIWFFKKNRFQQIRAKRLTNDSQIPKLTKLTTKQ